MSNDYILMRRIVYLSSSGHVESPTVKQRRQSFLYAVLFTIWALFDEYRAPLLLFCCTALYMQCLTRTQSYKENFGLNLLYAKILALLLV